MASYYAFLALLGVRLLLSGYILLKRKRQGCIRLGIKEARESWVMLLGILAFLGFPLASMVFLPIALDKLHSVESGSEAVGVFILWWVLTTLFVVVVGVWKSATYRESYTEEEEAIHRVEKERWKMKLLGGLKWIRRK